MHLTLNTQERSRFVSFWFSAPSGNCQKGQLASVVWQKWLAYCQTWDGISLLLQFKIGQSDLFSPTHLAFGSKPKSPSPHASGGPFENWTSAELGYRKTHFHFVHWILRQKLIMRNRPTCPVESTSFDLVHIFSRRLPQSSLSLVLGKRMTKGPTALTELFSFLLQVFRVCATTEDIFWGEQLCRTLSYQIKWDIYILYMYIYAGWLKGAGRNKNHGLTF